MPDVKDKVIEGDFTEKGETALTVSAPPKEVALSTQDPTEFLDRAVKQADALKRIIDLKELAIYIGGGTKAHVLIDGWQTLMALNGVMAYTLEARQTRCIAGECQVRKDCPGGRLTVHVVTQIRRVSDGVEMTKVEAECSQHESRWMRADDYAVLSMAQTRGVGKGCRQLFGWVMSLAGYNATPAEEMPSARDGSESPKPVAMPIGEADQKLIRDSVRFYADILKDKRAKLESKAMAQAISDRWTAFTGGENSQKRVYPWALLWAEGGPVLREAQAILGIERAPAEEAREAAEAAATLGSAEGATFDPETVEIPA